MPISREEVLHVASLCRILLTEEEVSRLQHQLSDILSQFEVLQELDTEAVPPGGHPRLSTVMRPDAPQDSFPVEEVLGNVPQRQGDFIRIPPVLEES